MNATLARAKELLAFPVLIVGALAAIFAASAWVVNLVGTGDRLSGHMMVEKQYHDSAAVAAKELDRHAEEQVKLTEALLRGECIENPKVNLARQGLLVKCRQLGIER